MRGDIAPGVRPDRFPIRSPVQNDSECRRGAVKSWQCAVFWQTHERNVFRNGSSTCGNVWPLDADRETSQSESIGRRVDSMSS